MTRVAAGAVLFALVSDRVSEGAVLLRGGSAHAKDAAGESGPVSGDILVSKMSAGQFCMTWAGKGDNVYASPCTEMNQRQEWYFDGEQVKSRAGDLCMDVQKDKNGGNVYMHKCHDGKNQKWYRTADGLMKARSSARCLDVDPTSKNIHMWDCHANSNQKFEWFGEHFRSRIGLICADFGHGNIYASDNCHGKPNQRFTIDARSRWHVASEKNLCLDYDYGKNNVYAFKCHDGKNQAWRMTDTGLLKTNYDDKCADVDVKTKNIIMHKCHGNPNQRFFWLAKAQAAAAAAAVPKFAMGLPEGPREIIVSKMSSPQFCMTWAGKGDNVYGALCTGSARQKWFYDGNRLKSKAGDKCLETEGNGNVKVADCSKSKSQEWFDDIEGVVKSKASPKCLDLHTVSKNIYLSDCHGGANQKWDFFGQELRSRFGLICIDWGNGNIYASDNCHGNPNQRFIIDAKGRWKVASEKNMCMDYNYGNGNVYCHTCHNGKNQVWKLDKDGLLKTTYDDKCADVHLQTKNIYMHKCHGNPNQRFYMMSAEQHKAEGGKPGEGGPPGDGPGGEFGSGDFSPY